MELPVRVEESIHRVATQSSTRNRALERKVRKGRRRTRSRRLDDLDDSSSDSSFSSEPTVQPDPGTLIAPIEKGVDANQIPEDISIVVREE